MFRHSIHADVESDVEALIADLRAKAEKAGLPEISVSMLTSRTKMTLEGLMQRGRDMAASGSTITVQQILEDENYHIRILFGAGAKPTWFERFSGWFRVR